MAAQKNHQSVDGAGELIAAALSPREIMVAAAAVKIAEKARFSQADRSALNSVFAKLNSGHSWQSQNKTADSKKPKTQKTQTKKTQAKKTGKV